MRKAFFLVALLLGACGEDRPPAPTDAENRQLDEAAEMLDQIGNQPAPAPPKP